MNNSLFSDQTEPALQSITLLGGNLIHHKCFLPRLESALLLADLNAIVPWQQDSIQMYGKPVAVPRLSAWYADDQRGYSYSGISLGVNPWSAVLLEIKNKIELFLDQRFNSVLINKYRDGSDSVAWHSDDEPELGGNPVIASLSLGATRRFHLRKKTDPTNEKIVLDLIDGDLLLMGGDTQHQWEHQISKTKRYIGERINLTFRTIKERPLS